MAINENIYGSKNGDKIFFIPVDWIATEQLQIRANSLEEAIKFVVDNMEEIPLGSEPEYLDGSYRISWDENETKDVKEIVKAANSYIKTHYFTSSIEATKYDCVKEL